jgi:hypothetical protein
MCNLRIVWVVRNGVIYGRVNNRDIVLTSLVNRAQKRSAFHVTPAGGIIFIVPVLIHIIDIRPAVKISNIRAYQRAELCSDAPNSLQRYTRLGEVGHNFFQIGPACVPPFALMIAKSKILLHRWHAHCAGHVALSDLCL